MRLVPTSRSGALGRFALGGVIVIAFAAATTAVAGLLQFKQFAKDIGATPAIKQARVTIADAGAPQTLLLIGSDHRAGTPFSSANTDTMMLVRIDPSSATINLLSIPRDLPVQLPGRVGTYTAKLNLAYSVGGPNLLVRVLRQQVFPRLEVNHIIDVNFGGFEALVNAIGCVYTDVDHRYYNNTAYTNYSSIDLQPGYQRLCGANALSFVRFRHSDNDIVRNARQQDFLRWAKAQYPASQLVANRDTLLQIFGQHTETDANLHTVDGLINLFNLVAFSAGHSIKQIPFPAVILPCGPGPPAVAGQPAVVTPCYVTASAQAEAAAFRAFMSVTRPAPAAGATPPGGSGSGAPTNGGGGPGPGAPGGLTGDLSDGATQAAQLGQVGMPVYVPGQILTGSSYCTSATCTEGPVPNSYPRKYLIRDPGGATHAAYRLTLVKNSILGQYYGVQGTTWQNPPILDSPNQTRMVDGKRLLLFTNGGKLTVVGWRTPAGAYWISNTLTGDIGNQQMIAIAASLAPTGR
ncbi:MAG: LCP family protein [Solirubrobacterales bacterium]|nr:LCP family protein [Solirubrobacterales bacterium]